MRNLWLTLFTLLAGGPALAASQAPAQTPAQAPAQSPACEYHIRLQDEAGLMLAVQVTCSGERLPVFDRPVDGDLAAALTGFEPGSDGRSLRYGLHLDRLAALANTADIAQRIDRAVISPLSTWLADPGLPEATITLTLEALDGLHYAINLPQRDDGRLHLRRSDIRFGGYAVFGRFSSATVPVGNAVIEVVSFPGRAGPPVPLVQAWIADSAQAVAAYFGGFPLARTLLLVVPVPDRAGVVFGRVRGGGGGTILLQLGEQAQRAALHDDWILVHEMIHLAAPFITGRSAWVMEGMATYLEPLIRTRAGWRSTAQLWQEFVSDMPRGIPALTVESLDAVSRAGLYWGGATFMLLADLDIRERSQNRASLQTCLRAVLRAGGDTTTRWSRERFFATCDAATGTGTMARLGERYARQASMLDLAALWRDLGISTGPAGIVFDDNAPLAPLRRAITTEG
ncbi:hypothetical protein [Ferrovibrio sp.]|uniref:hypothetical protein n=1 Tax=Ferrovibrio sp. TaxID=1917215 RepID=UPI002628CA15|nr:hypothetical protein [Ferrovibrio sp.]